MKNKLRLLTLIAWALLLIACDDDEITLPCADDAPGTSLNKIMPLGASRVEGARPAFESYRYELWKRLVDGDWDFDYLGSQCDPATYPAYAEMNFDVQHEGRGGYTSGQIRAGIEDWLSRAGTPDIVLFSSPGGNDALSGLPYAEAIANINSIIDILQTANPDVTILIERLAPGRSADMTPEVTAYLTQLQEEVQTIAAAQTTANSRILTVDMATGFSDAYLADAVHYNQAGAAFVAARYYEVLDDVLRQ